VAGDEAAVHRLHHAPLRDGPRVAPHLHQQQDQQARSASKIGKQDQKASANKQQDQQAAASEQAAARSANDDKTSKQDQQMTTRPASSSKISK
jgi:hypothetical protein